MSRSLADVPWDRLSPRAREALEDIVPLVDEGHSNDEVARRLGEPWTRKEVARARALLADEIDALVRGAQLPNLNQDDYDALKESIRTHGQRVPILVSKTGEVIDGSHRLRACQELNVKPWMVELDDVDDPEQLRAIGLTVNVARRQLGQKDKRKVVEAELIRDPKASDRSIAWRTGVSHPTVASVRVELVERGKVENLSTRVGLDGVKQPVAPPSPEAPPEEEPVDDTVALQVRVSERTARERHAGQIKLVVIPVSAELYEHIAGNEIRPVAIQFSHVAGDEHDLIVEQLEEPFVEFKEPGS